MNILSRLKKLLTIWTLNKLGVRSFLNLSNFERKLIMKKHTKSNGIKSSHPLPQVTVGNFEVLNTTKSEGGKKEYKTIRLENGLTACLISELTADASQDTKFDSDSSESESEGTEATDESGDHDRQKTKKGGQEVQLAAVSLCVGVGSFSDPKEVPGMAHFLEHMVFMGSEKFPKENDFNAYIKRNLLYLLQSL